MLRRAAPGPRRPRPQRPGAASNPQQGRVPTHEGGHAGVAAENGDRAVRVSVRVSNGLSADRRIAFLPVNIGAGERTRTADLLITKLQHGSSLPRLVALLRPVWVIIDTWQHYLKAHRVTDTAGPRRAGTPARRCRRRRAGVRGACHGRAPQREEPQRVPRFDGSRRDRGHDRVSRSQRNGDSPPPRAVRTLALGPCGHPLGPWRRLRGGRGCGRGVVESAEPCGNDRRYACCCICLSSIPTLGRPREYSPLRSGARVGGTTS